MPTNLYGPHDNFDLDSSHVLPALLRKFHQAMLLNDPAVPVWGSGRPRREFLHVDDMAAASIHLLELEPEAFWSVASERCSHINVGSGSDISIAELAALIGTVTGFVGAVEFDASMPDGTPRKLLDVSRLGALGWQARIGLEQGVRQTYAWMTAHWEEIASA
jgi:GDP-L-fucose synthase